MYDRLLFVEGPSDEAVMRELAKTLDIDLAQSNIGFVQMGGVRNFAHFAAEATIALLARRRIRLWFVADRDERDEIEVKRMVERLGNTATLKVLERRELENYLLDPVAIARFIAEKRAAAALPAESPPVAEVNDLIDEVARGLKEEVIRLRFRQATLRPVFLHGREDEGSVEDRLSQAVELLSERMKGLAVTRDRIVAEVGMEWERVASQRAPGSLILDAVARRYDVRFSKDSGDAARLARLLRREAIPDELRHLLQEVTGEPSTELE